MKKNNENPKFFLPCRTVFFILKFDHIQQRIFKNYT